MQLELKGLIIDQETSSLEALDAALQPDVVFEYLDVVNSVHKAVQYHIDMDFDICFISEKFPAAEVKSFFSDYEKLEKKIPCIFIQFREKCDFDLDRESLQSQGFAAIISYAGDHKDKEYLWKALKPLINKQGYQEAVSELDSVVNKLLNEVDKIARERKRGKNKKLNNIVGRYLQDTSTEFENLKQAYLDKLIKETEEAEAFEPTEVVIPDAILDKKLPELKKDGYKGQSHRVHVKVESQHADKNKVSEYIPPPNPKDSESNE
jgi:hypothetical protein